MLNMAHYYCIQF